MSNSINMKTIAEKAGVSVATVSRVINKNGRFSDETEEKVKKVIEELNYHPNTLAKSLKENHTKVIGVVVSDITNPHFARLVLELENMLFAHSYSTVICNTNENEELEKRHIDTLISQRVSGIIIISGLKVYDLNEIPVVYLDQRPKGYQMKNHCLIETDNLDGGYLATKKLIEAGCKNIAVMYSFEKDYSQKVRIKGYKKALKEAGLEEHYIAVGKISTDKAATFVKDYIDKGNKVDGLMCTNDILAVGAIKGLQEKQLSVPESVKVTGFDDSILAQLYYPSISSIQQSIDRMVKKTVELLFAVMNNDKVDSIYNLSPVKLVERDSTKTKK